MYWPRNESPPRFFREINHDPVPDCAGGDLPQVRHIQCLPCQGDHWRLQERRTATGGCQEKTLGETRNKFAFVIPVKTGALVFQKNHLVPRLRGEGNGCRFPRVKIEVFISATVAKSS